ncbi:MAG: glycosyltransferase family 9 protein [Pirellulales bacterium]|nr:glycosyltransferase family 9 protein [Pirellulales bacterium]
MRQRILIVKPSSMGDIVHTLPASLAIRQAYPDAHLAWLVERAHAELLARQKHLDEVFVWDRRDIRGLPQFVRRLREGGWDAAIDFQGLLRSGLFTWVSGARRRIGYTPSKEGAHLFYTERLPLDMSRYHAVERHLQLARLLNAELTCVPIERPYLDGGHVAARRDSPPIFPLFPSEKDEASVDAWLARHQFDPARERLIVLNPDCRKAANRWPTERFAEVARLLKQQPHLRVVLCGGPASRELCDEIDRLAGGGLWRADGQFGLLASTALIARSAVMLTGDTGPMHLAVAVGTLVVALFGPASPRLTGPYASDAIVLNEQLSCAPCFGRRCHLGFDRPPCMEGIAATATVEAVRRQLALFESGLGRKFARKSA